MSVIDPHGTVSNLDMEHVEFRSNWHANTSFLGN